MQWHRIYTPNAQSAIQVMIIIIKHHGLLNNNNCIRHYFASGSLGSHVDAIMANPADGGYLNPVREAGVVRGDGNRIE